MSLKDEFQDDNYIKAVEILVGNMIRELLTDVTKIEKNYARIVELDKNEKREVKLKVTAYWVGDQIRIDIK